MKQCNRCKQEKPLSEFAVRKNKGVIPYCRTCNKEYNKEFYQRTIQKRRERKAVNSKAIRTRNTKYIWNYLANNPCIDCGEKDPIVLEFDHRENKEYNVSCMTTLSLEAIEKEIAKCDIRCANCHRRKTAKQFNWYKDITGCSSEEER